MSDDVINTGNAAEPVGAYPHARKVGNLLFLSGVGPRKPGSKDIPGVTGGHDIKTQVRSTFENVKAVLEAAGSDWEKIVDITCFLTDMERDFKAYNEAYAEHFPNNKPCRTTVEVGALPTPIAFEVKVIATVN